MPRVDSIEIAGLELWFRSDDHLGPHFHAEAAGAWEARVFFLRRGPEMIEVKWSLRKMSPKHRRSLVAQATENREALLREWERKVVVKNPGPRE